MILLKSFSFCIGEMFFKAMLKLDNIYLVVF
jgi:hypothetical protein